MVFRGHVFLDRKLVSTSGLERVCWHADLHPGIRVDFEFSGIDGRSQFGMEIASISLLLCVAPKQYAYQKSFKG